MTDVLPLRIYAWADNILEDSTVLRPDGLSTMDTTYTAANLYDWNPGKPGILAPWWTFRDGSSYGLDNHVITAEYPPGTGTDMAIPPQGYTSAALATVLDGLMGWIPAIQWAHSSTTNKWTAGSAMTWQLMWTNGLPQQRCAATLGYDGSADDTGATSYVSDDPTVCSDAQLVGWDTSAVTREKPVKCVMIYMGPSVLGTTDTVTCYGSTKDHGGDWMAWDGGSEYKGDEQTLKDDGVNHLHLWFPEDDGMTSPLRYWMIVVKRKATATSATRTKIGVAGIWHDCWYENDYNYDAPWSPELVRMDVTSRAPGGGGLSLSRNREHFRITMPFRQWPGTVYRALAKLRWKHGLQPHLVVCNPANVVTDNAIFGTIEELSKIKYYNVEEDADFDMVIEQVPMEARGPLT